MQRLIGQAWDIAASARELFEPEEYILACLFERHNITPLARRNLPNAHVLITTNENRACICGVLKAHWHS